MKEVERPEFVDDNDYEFENEFVDNYEYKKKPSMTDTVPFKLYENLGKSLLALPQVFPDFEQDITAMGMEITAKLAMPARNKSVSVYPPGADDASTSTSRMYIFNQPEIVSEMKDFHKRYDELLDKMTEKYPPEQNSVESRIVKVMKNNSEMMKNPDFYDHISGFPEYSASFQTSTLDMPTPEFHKETVNGRKRYEVDMPRYRKFMEEHAFLAQLEDKQNFFMKEYIPYAQKLKAGTLTSGDAERYNIAYAEHMVKQKAFFEEITGYSHEKDAEIAANKTCNEKGQFVDNWTGPRFGKATLNKANESIRLMDNGWPAADIPFLQQLKRAKENLDNKIAADKDKSFNAKELEEAKKISKNMKSAYENIMDKAVTSPEDRFNKLTAIEKSVNDYTKLITDNRKRTNGNKDKITIGEDALSWLFDEAKGRKVFRAEVGKNKTHYEDLKKNIDTEMKEHLLQVCGSLRKSQEEEFKKTDLFSSMHEENDKAFNQINSKKHYVPHGKPVIYFAVEDENEYKKVREDCKKLADYADEMMDKSIEDDEIGIQMKEYIKTRTSSPIRRMLKGQSNLVLAGRTPIGHGIKVLNNMISIELDNDKFRNNFKKWQHKFPVYKLSIEGERQLQTFADYYDEKDKAGGALSPEREQQYRQKIYDQTVSMLPMMNKIFSSVENEKLHGELQKDHVLFDDQFCVHPAAQRGSKTLYTALNAYKTGLENGWALDDIPYLAHFDHLLLSMEVSHTVGHTLKLEGFKNRTPAEFKSEEHKQYYLRMKALSEEMKEKPITSVKDRNSYIDRMNSLIEEGLEKKYLYANTKPIYEALYYEQLKNRQLERSINIGKGKEQVFYNEPVLASADRKLAPIMSDITSARTDMWWSKESTVHENLRIAAEALQKFMKENPAPGADADKKTLTDYSMQYLAKLDAVQHYSKLYQEKREGASSSGGKDRLRGSKDIYDFAEREKIAIMERLKTKTKAYSDINDFRKAALSEKMSEAYKKLAAMNAMPITKEAQNKIIDMAADIMLGRFATSNNNSAKSVNDMGYDVLKSEIKNSSDFKKMMKSYMSDKNMTPKKLSEELTGDGVLRRIKDSASSIKKFEDKLKVRDEKAKAAEAKHQRNKAKLEAAETRKKAENDRKKAAGRKIGN